MVFLELWNSTFWPLLNFFTLLYLEPSHKTLFSWSWMNVQWHFLYKFTFFMWQWPQTIWDLDSTDNNSRFSSKFNLRWSLKVSFKRSNILKNRKKIRKKVFFLNVNVFYFFRIFQSNHQQLFRNPRNFKWVKNNSKKC